MRLELRGLHLLITIYNHLNAEGVRPDLAASLLRLINCLSKQNEGAYAAHLYLTREQVERDIPYQAVCEARYGSRWNTGTRKRRWASEFSEEEQHSANGLFQQAQTWALKSGVPARVKMSEAIYDLWQKLGDFCASL